MFCFFFTFPATTEIYTLSLHDALPISISAAATNGAPTRHVDRCSCAPVISAFTTRPVPCRSEEHTSELQSRVDLVCRLLLEKKNVNVLLMASWLGTLARRPALSPWYAT